MLENIHHLVFRVTYILTLEQLQHLVPSPMPTCQMLRGQDVEGLTGIYVSSHLLMRQVRFAVQCPIR